MLKHSKFSEIREACSQSCLFAGLPFKATVYEGRRLCRGVGTRVTKNIQMLVAERNPKNVRQFQGRPQNGPRCS